MSLLVTLILNDGIIMASDSRTTYSNNVENKVTYVDKTYKTFVYSSKIGISHCFNATVNGKVVQEHLVDFKEKFKNRSIKYVPYLLKEYFLALDSNCNVSFLVAGYDQYNHKKAYRVSTKGVVEILDSSQPYIYWEGERNLPARLFSEMYYKHNNRYIKLQEYKLDLNKYSIDQGIRLVKYIINATKEYMSFFEEKQTVGGNIDVLVIKENSIYWY